LNDEQARQLGFIHDSGHHKLALINDILDISKIEAGELQVAAEPFDLAVSVRKVQNIVAPLAEKKRLAFSVTGIEHAGAMTGDARRVEQVLLNLLGNAIKFTETGSVTLAIQPVADFHPGSASAPVAAVRLRVTDTGIGIKVHDIPMLCQPFRQIDSTLHRNHDGTGLGLAISERLTRLMGGTIDIQSQWGHGSTFSITLPREVPEVT
jgi:signal transduction histidine kinase